MDRFLSCDWGTSSFRLRLIKTDKLTVLAEEVNADGIADIYKEWTQSGKDENERLLFYKCCLGKQIVRLEDRVGYALNEMPVLLSGMASSSIGMIELPYKELPFKVDGSDIDHRMIPASAQFSHDLFIISGARTSDDVLRGEETMLIGSEYEDNDMERVFIFPGTHSKHIYVHKGVATHFKTYMTGELFNLLARKVFYQTP
jgi:2-dehydro-3-deoxygalactonokinase